MGRFELKNVRECEDGFTHAELVVNDEKPVFVAVYGTLMEGENNAHWAGNSKRTTVTIKGDLFDTGWGSRRSFRRRKSAIRQTTSSARN